MIGWLERKWEQAWNSKAGFIILMIAVIATMVYVCYMASTAPESAEPPWYHSGSPRESIGQ